MKMLRTIGAASAILALTAVGAQAQSTNATDQDNKVGSQKSMDNSSMESKSGKTMAGEKGGATGASSANGTKDTGTPNLRGHSDTPTQSGK